MIEAIHKGVEIELEVHQFQPGWKCDCTLIKHPERTKTLSSRGRRVRDDGPGQGICYAKSSRSNRPGTSERRREIGVARHGIGEYEAKRFEGRVKDGGLLLSVHNVNLLTIPQRAPRKSSAKVVESDQTSVLAASIMSGSEEVRRPFQRSVHLPLTNEVTTWKPY